MTTLRDVAREVRDRADLAEVIGGYIQLRRAGPRYSALCPFHPDKKTPSFSVDPARGTWHCFGCHRRGTVIDFVMEIEKLDFREALELLARRYGVELPKRLSWDPEQARRGDEKRDALLRVHQWALEWFRENLTRYGAGGAGGAPAGIGAIAAYMRRREITPETQKAFFLGAAPAEWDALTRAAARQGFGEDLLVEAGLAAPRQSGGGVYDRFRGRLIFPILDPVGRCVAFGGRIVEEDPEGKTAKYINSPETPLYQKRRLLYGLYQAQQAIGQKKRALLVEGYMDCVMAWQWGFQETVASLGTALTEDQARLLRRYCRDVIFVYDGDAAGIKAMREGGEALVRAGLQTRVAVLPPEDDPDSLLRREGAEGFSRFLDSARDLFDFLIECELPAGGEAPDIRHRVAAMEAVAPLLIALENQVELDLRLKQAAQRLGVESSVARDYLRRRAASVGPGGKVGGGGKFGPGRAAPGARAAPALLPGAAEPPVAGLDVGAQSRDEGLAAPAPHRMELAVLKAALGGEEALEWIRASMEASWFSAPVRQLIQQVFEAAAAGEEWFPEEWRAGMEEGEEKRLLGMALYDEGVEVPVTAAPRVEVVLRL